MLDLPRAGHRASGGRPVANCSLCECLAADNYQIHCQPADLQFLYEGQAEAWEQPRPMVVGATNGSE